MAVDIDASEDLKLLGNAAFKSRHFSRAEDLYSQAIEKHPSNPVLWSNRAAAHLHLEEYGSAISDATKAIELDPSFTKAYYRRGEAQFSLSHFQEAVGNFRSAAKLSPQDPMLRKRLQESERLLKIRKFEEALSMPEDTTSALRNIVLDDIVVEESYTGPKMERQAAEDGEETAADRYVLTRAFVLEMIEEFSSRGRCTGGSSPRSSWSLTRGCASCRRSLTSPCPTGTTSPCAATRTVSSMICSRSSS